MRRSLFDPGVRKGRTLRGVRALMSSSMLALFAPSAAAFQPLIADDTGTQGAGGNQVELALNRQELKTAGDTTTTRTWPLVYTRGITDALDVYAGVSYARISSTDPSVEARGHGNPVVGLKWRFYEDDEQKLSIGFKPEIQLKAARDYEARGLGNGRNGYSGLLILTQETSFGAVHVNYGFTQVNYALEANRLEQRRKLHRLSVAPVFEVGERWKLAIDTGLTTNPDRAQRSRMGYVELGAICSPSKDLDFALGLIAFIGDGEPRSSTLTAGVTWRFR